MTENIVRDSILRDYTHIIFHASSYLVGSNLIPKEYGYNIEIETKMINGKLDVTGVNYWVDELPSKGYIERTENFKEKVIFNINASDQYRPYGIKKEILNFIINQLKPKIGYKEEEIVYEKYLLGRRLYVFGKNDTQKNYYWYGIGNEIVSKVESNVSEGKELFESDESESDSESEELSNLLSESIIVNNSSSDFNQEIPH